MAKDNKDTVDEITSGIKDTPSSSGSISIIEFFKRNKNKFDKYVIAYLSVEHKGDTKKESEWQNALEKHMLKK